MNYLLELIAFRNYLKYNPVPAIAQALWWDLIDRHNSSNWEQWITVDNRTLEGALDITEPTLIKYRNILIAKKLIEYESKQRMKHCGKYRVISLVKDYGKEPSTKKNLAVPYVVPYAESLAVPYVVPYAESLDKDLKDLKSNKNKPKLVDRKPATKSPVKIVLARYTELWIQKFNPPNTALVDLKRPVINYGKDGKIIKNLLAQNNLQVVLQVLELLFATDDEWISQTGYSIGVLHTVFNQLLKSLGSGNKPSTSESPDDYEKIRRDNEEYEKYLLQGVSN